MNWWLLAGAVMAGISTAGHAFAGRSMFYQPIKSVLQSEVLGGVLTGMWHLITIHFTLSAIMLLALSTGYIGGVATAWLIAAQFAGYAAVYLVISLSLGGAAKLFQWMPFSAVAICSALGALR